MEFEKVIKTRSSTRQFSERQVEQEKLDKILEAGRLAPTAKNNQPIKIYVVRSEEGLKKIDKASPCRYGAQTCLIVCGNTLEAYKKGDYSTYEMDSCIVATHMLLAATNEGVDDIWIEMFDGNILREEFDIPTNLIPVCLIPLGYRKEDARENPMHSIRKEISELVEYK
jgi:nitroreductase